MLIPNGTSKHTYNLFRGSSGLVEFPADNERLWAHSEHLTISFLENIISAFKRSFFLQPPNSEFSTGFVYEPATNNLRNDGIRGLFSSAFALCLAELGRGEAQPKRQLHLSTERSLFVPRINHRCIRGLMGRYTRISLQKRRIPTGTQWKGLCLCSKGVAEVGDRDPYHHRCVKPSLTRGWKLLIDMGAGFKHAQSWQSGETMITVLGIFQSGVMSDSTSTDGGLKQDSHNICPKWFLTSLFGPTTNWVRSDCGRLAKLASAYDQSTFCNRNVYCPVILQIMTLWQKQGSCESTIHGTVQ